MLCDECKKSEAVYHSIKKINGITTERHLCAECQARNSAGQLSPFSYPGLGDFFSNFTSLFDAPNPKREVKICSVCGTSSSDFLNSGFLGCDKCYSEFSDVVMPVIQKVQSGTYHKGKAPGESKISRAAGDEYERLRRELEHAIETENYEQATVVRDKMRTLRGE